MPAWLVSLTQWWFTGAMGTILYWMPLIVCLAVYFYTVVEKIREDYEKRTGEMEEGVSDFYNPEVTIGTIIGYIFISVCPGINLVCFFRETAWKLIKFVFERIEWIFEIPIIPDTHAWKESRKKRYDEYRDEIRKTKGY